MNTRNYWKNFYNDNQVVSTGNAQSNVGRTIQGQPINDVVWTRTLEYIAGLLKIDSSSDVLELCCGNGLLIGPLSMTIRNAYGVDFSQELIKQLHTEFGDRVETKVIDVLKLNWESASLDAVLIYFSIQHFSDAEALILIQRALSWLRPGGKILIGDIPDLAKKWSYIDRPEYRNDYLQRLLDSRPMIGHWFEREFFIAMNDFFSEAKIEVLNQPDYHINSKIRFDAVITKANS